MKRAVSLPLGSFSDDKPVVLSLVYHECPMLCNEVLRGCFGPSESFALMSGRNSKC